MVPPATRRESLQSPGSPCSFQKAVARSIADDFDQMPEIGEHPKGTACRKNPQAFADRCEKGILSRAFDLPTNRPSVRREVAASRRPARSAERAMRGPGERGTRSSPRVADRPRRKIRTAAPGWSGVDVVRMSAIRGPGPAIGGLRRHSSPWTCPPTTDLEMPDRPRENRACPGATGSTPEFRLRSVLRPRASFDVVASDARRYIGSPPRNQYDNSRPRLRNL